MDVDAPLALLGGLSPAAFMARHWHKRPLLVRGACPGVVPPVPRAALFALAASPDVESRLVRHDAGGWHLRHGPLPRRALPPLSRPGWTLLVQGLDLHDDAAHRLLQQFAFVPAARLDDLMVSYATDGGGVGPHVDSYDVFLLQVQGQRRWRIGPLVDDALVDGAPLKLLRRFEPTDDWLLSPGDMLYLPPGWAHDGMAVGECMTASVGFRAPSDAELARELLQRLADEEPTRAPRLYRDPRQPATAAPAAVPPALAGFAQQALVRWQADPQRLACLLGELLSEPKPRVWFEPGQPLPMGSDWILDRRTRMLYDDAHIFVNGEAYRAGGRDAVLLRQLADGRRLNARDARRLSASARELVDAWAGHGWLHAVPTRTTKSPASS